MVDYQVPAYEDQWFESKNENVSDLHAYYMSQFNLELENSNKTKPNVEILDNFKYGTEESIDFEVLGSWNEEIPANAHFEGLDKVVVNNNINEQNIKDVLLDLDGIEFDDKSYKTVSVNSGSIETQTDLTLYEPHNEYIDDESLIDELCREDGETNTLGHEFNDDNIVPNENMSLPSIETAFSKQYSKYNMQNTEYSLPFNNMNNIPSNIQPISSLEQYSYPNNILYNLEHDKVYSLPDTPTSCNEFNFERHGRTVSISDSIESDVQSCSYYDENSENFDEDELFVNLDEFGLMLERDNEVVRTQSQKDLYKEKYSQKEKSQGEKICLWEHCFERYPDQNTLVEHIERMHVNTYKGDEFSCLWRDCTRARRPFNARYKLLIHMRVHSGHKPNQCHHPGCGKAFSRLENLKIHVRSHTGERPYACLAPHCRKAFSNSSDRAKHQRTHFNARPYACGATGCGKRYTDPSSLRKHIKTHPHFDTVPRTYVVPMALPARKEEQATHVSPAKLATLKSIRDKLTVARVHRL